MCPPLSAAAWVELTPYRHATAAHCDSLSLTISYEPCEPCVYASSGSSLRGTGVESRVLVCHPLLCPILTSGSPSDVRAVYHMMWLAEIGDKPSRFGAVVACDRTPVVRYRLFSFYHLTYLPPGRSPDGEVAFDLARGSARTVNERGKEQTR